MSNLRKSPFFLKVLKNAVLSTCKRASCVFLDVQADNLRSDSFSAAPDFKEPKVPSKGGGRARGPKRQTASASVLKKSSDDELALPLPKELTKQITDLKSTLSKGEIFDVVREAQAENVVSVKAAAVQAVESDLHSVVSSFLEATFGIGPGACEITFNRGWSTTSMKGSSAVTTFERNDTPAAGSETLVSSSVLNEEELQALDKNIVGGICFYHSEVFDEYIMPPGRTVIEPWLCIY